LLLTYVRTGIIYLVLIAAVRLLGKRQVGQMEPSEFVVTMLVANLASIPMEDPGIPLLSGVVPIGTVLGMELLLSALCLRSIFVRKLLCGKPVILIENGKILQENLRRTRVTLDELTGHLREKEVLDLRSVQYAILETNGNLSVFPYPREKPASARDAGVRALRDNMKKAGKDQRWLLRVLEERQATVEQTWLLTVDGGDSIVFYRKEEGR